MGRIITYENGAGKKNVGHSKQYFSDQCEWPLVMECVCGLLIKCNT